MNRKNCLRLIWLRLALLKLLALSVLVSVASAQTPLRVAVFEISGDETGEVQAALNALVQAERASFELLEPALVRVAALGAGYKGSLNLPVTEAQALGLSLGCDFYFLGKVFLLKRTESGKPVTHEALAGLFVVETRTGELASFEFFREAAASESEARQKLLAALRQRWTTQSQAMRAAQTRHLEEVANVGQPLVVALEVLNDDELGKSGQQPLFYQRLKPTYPQEAELMSVTATVELEAVFQADGRVGEIRVTRWAGFGLDEAACETVRKLRFKPAQQAGKDVTLRGLVRYTFRRPASMAERLEETERLKRSLRELKNPVPVPRPE